MKKSRRFIILILIFNAFLETSFVGCGGGSSNSFEGTNQSAKKTDYQNIEVNKNGSISQRFSKENSSASTSHLSTYLKFSFNLIAISSVLYPLDV